MKVKEFINTYKHKSLLDTRINKFIKNKELIDIRYCVVYTSQGLFSHALVMYEDD